MLAQNGRFSNKFLPRKDSRCRKPQFVAAVDLFREHCTVSLDISNLKLADAEGCVCKYQNKA